MGVLVTFESVALLLQREDFAAALRALKKLAKEEADAFCRDPEAVARAKDLPSALAAAEFRPQLDAYGDLVGLRYAGDKLPPGASDEFPEQLVFAWKGLLRSGVFDRWVEGKTMQRVSIKDRKVFSRDWYPPRRRFEQVGEPPRCRPGDAVDISFRYAADIAGDDTVVNVKRTSTSGPCAIDFAQRNMRPGEVATVRVRVSHDQGWYPEKESFVIYGDTPAVAVRGWLTVAMDIPEDLDAAHEVIAIEWGEPWRGDYLPGKSMKAALEDLRRYAVRHAQEPGGAFLAQVAEAPDVIEALRHTGFDAQPGGGGIESIAFNQPRLAGSERHVLGLLRSIAPLTTPLFGHLRLAYRTTPDWWTTLEFKKGAVERGHERRASS